MGLINKDILKRMRHNTNRLQQMKNKDYYIVVLDDFTAKKSMDKAFPESIIQWTTENRMRNGHSPLSLNVFERKDITNPDSYIYANLYAIMKLNECSMYIYANTVGSNMQDLVNALEKDLYVHDISNKTKLISKIS